MSNAFLSKFIYKRFPQFISYIFHPLLLPTIGVYIILNSGTYISMIPTEAKRIILLLVGTCTFGLPLAFMPFFYYGKITSSLELRQKQERIIPLLITASFYYLSFYLLRRMEVPEIIQAFILSSAIAVTLTLFVSTKWKISAHMIGMGGVLGLIVYLSIQQDADIILYFMTMVIISGITGFARLSLNSHTPSQVYAGLASGFFLTVLTMLLF
jgi:hypothetical protein